MLRPRWILPLLLAAAFAAMVTVALVRRSTPPPGAERCALAPEAGPCRAYVSRWRFDVTTGQCRSFVWGGCQGVVPFESQAECAASCMNR